MEQKSKHLMHCHLAGFTYGEGVKVFSELKIGIELQLRREECNKHDPDAIAVYYKDYHLGYIPASQNEMLALFLEQGYDALFEVYINRISPDQKPEGQIGLTIMLRHQAALSQ